MKLFEIKDITSYRPGDEDDPRSPDYVDPMDGVNISDYAPVMPSATVKFEAGRDKHNDAYSFKFIIQWPQGAEDDHDIEYYISNAFADQFPQYETIWDESAVINGGQALVMYLQGNAPQLNSPKAANQMNATLQQIVQQISDKIASEKAEKAAYSERDSRRNTGKL